MPKRKSTTTTDLAQKGMKAYVKIIEATEPALSGDSSVYYTAQNARFTAECSECGKPRILYAKSKLTERYKFQLASEYGYTRAAPLTPLDHVLHGKLFSRLNIDFGSPMESAYYSAIHYHPAIAQLDRCFYCGVMWAVVDTELKKKSNCNPFV